MHEFELNFEPSPGRAGFRLQRLEVLNWGTFDKKVHILVLHGQTALLIGENGSGKSTLVDALLTLLVPNQKRNYNLASGAQSKRERNEKTYIRGAYGSEEREQESRAQTRYLRAAGQESILLASFANEATGEFVTIAQILWVNEDTVKKLHLTATRSCSIVNDLDLGGVSAKKLRETLRTRGFAVEDEFKHYARKFVGQLKMGSETTLELLNQTVSIKEIENVSTFIRNHMLDRLETRELLTQLDQHYDDLLGCWNKIELAKKQLSLLSPIEERGREHAEILAKISNTEQLEAILPAHFALRLSVLLEEDLAAVASRLAELGPQREGLTCGIEELTGRETDLRVAINSNEIGKRLEDVKKRLAEVTDLEKQRKRHSDDYHRQLNALGRAEEITSQARFTELADWAETQHAQETDVMNARATEEGRLNASIAELKTRYESRERELDSLRRRRDLIPERERRLRQLIADGAGVTFDQLPFAGELIEVRETQKPWRGALERLLRGFGLSMLVPETLYGPVNRFINDTTLRGRIAYHRVPRSVPPGSAANDRGRVLEKLELRPGNPMRGWLDRELRHAFNHLCCESLAEFESSHGYAVTKQGLIRTGGTRHVKDDTRSIDDESEHILGWSNAAKIAALERQLTAIGDEGQKLLADLTTAKTRKDEAKCRTAKLQILLRHRQFPEIDWRASACEREALEREKRELEAASDEVQALQSLLKQVLANRDQLTAQLGSMEREVGGLEKTRDDARALLAEQQSLLESYRDAEVGAFDHAVLELLADGAAVTVKNAAARQSEAQRAIGEKLKRQQERKGRIENAIVKAMGEFFDDKKEAYPDLDAGIEFLPDFLRLKETIDRDELHIHQDRFRKLMSEDVFNHMALFHTTLDDHRAEMEVKIGHLNETLRGIDYTPHSFIEIQARATIDPEVRDFRRKLRECLGESIGADDAARESAFNRIRILIDELRATPRWREKVIDTRNWLMFAVRELRRADGGEENYYNDTSGRSGGQKAKLAFTILASAIAYQYGIAKNAENPESFRFVVIDEMFGKSDEPNSRYALRLFERFHLQLLIVCPFDAKAKVVEPFVSSYHLALNPKSNDSSIRTITLEEMHEQLRT